jgi:hypothetical protein
MWAEFHISIIPKELHGILHKRVLRTAALKLDELPWARTGMRSSRSAGLRGTLPPEPRQYRREVAASRFVEKQAMNVVAQAKIALASGEPESLGSPESNVPGWRMGYPNFTWSLQAGVGCGLRAPEDAPQAR